MTRERLTGAAIAINLRDVVPGCNRRELTLRDLGPDEGDRVGGGRDGGEERVGDARREGVDAEHLVQGVAAELRGVRDEVGGRRDRADLLLQLD